MMSKIYAAASIAIALSLFIMLLATCDGNAMTNYTRSQYNQMQVEKCIRAFEYSREKCELIIDNPRIDWDEDGK